jgi:transposase
MAKKKNRRECRKFTREFKAEAVRLAEAGGKSVTQVAKELDLTESALRNWVDQTRAERQGGLTADERVEFVRLRREVKRLEMEREILKKAPTTLTSACVAVPGFPRSVEISQVPGQPLRTCPGL